MGVSGVEGVFRRCCEETARVLRSNADMLVRNQPHVSKYPCFFTSLDIEIMQSTVVQVFTHDPLYKWALSPAKMQQIQRGRSDEAAAVAAAAADLQEVEALGVEGNPHAHRALLRLQQKLAGQEASGLLSVSGQVAKLIADARDPVNLCMLFHGWRAWL